VAIVGEGKPIRIGNVYSQGELVVAGTEEPVAGPSGMQQNKKKCMPPDACPPLEELVKNTLVQLKTQLFEQLKTSVKKHTDHRQITDDDLREAIDEVGETLTFQIPEHLGVVDSIVENLNEKAKKRKIIIEHPDILPHFERFLTADYAFGQHSFRVVPPEHNIEAVVPPYVVDPGEQIINTLDYYSSIEGDALNLEIRRRLEVMQDYNRRMNHAREIANIRIRSIQELRRNVIRLEMLTETYEDNYGRDIAAILESFAANIQLWHGIQQRNINLILRLRRRQFMLYWFRTHYYPIYNRTPPQFQGQNMVLHLQQNALSQFERRFVNDPTVTNLPTLEESERIVLPHELSNNDIIDGMMGQDHHANSVSNRDPQIHFSLARGGVEDEGFRLRQIVPPSTTPRPTTPRPTTPRPTRAPRPTRFPRIELKRDV
jgi:hypothetical protein